MLDSGSQRHRHHVGHRRSQSGRGGLRAGASVRVSSNE
jgi:hypothetical protein